VKPDPEVIEIDITGPSDQRNMIITVAEPRIVSSFNSVSGT
jgi:hypothetical protein